MAKRTRRAPLRWWLLLAGLLAFASRAARAQTATPLHQAVADNLVLGQIAASAANPGELALTLTPAGDPFMIAIPPGTRFVPDDDALSEVISVEPVEMLIREATTIDPLHVAGLTPDKGMPFPLNTAGYSVGGMVEGPLLALLDQLQDRQPIDDSVAQLAIWAVYQGRSVDEIVAGLHTPPSPADAAAARELAAGQPVPPPVDDGAPAGQGDQPSGAGGESSDESGATPDEDGSFPWAALVIGVVGVAAAIVGIAYFAQRKSATPAGDDGGIAASAFGQTMLQSSGAPPKQPAKSDKIDTESSETGAGLFIGQDGPNAGKALNVHAAAIIARNLIPVQALRLDGVSSPHVYLYWSTENVYVRDLNSAGGTTLDGQVLGREEATARFGSVLMLGNRVAVSLNMDGIQVGDKVHKAPQSQMIISREPLNVLALGEGDKKLSNPHCLVRREGSDYFVRDLHSRNGVIVGDQTLGTDEAAIPPGTSLRLGLTTFSRSGD